MPELAVTAPADGEPVAQNNLAIKGTVSDNGYGVDKVEYTLKRGSTTVTSSSVNPVTIKGEQWYIAETQNGGKMPLGDTEGALSLTVTATEKKNGSHGGRTKTETVDFYYDAANPELTESGIGTTSPTTNAGFTLTGKVWDTNELDRIEIKCGSTTWTSGSSANVTLTKAKEEPSAANWTAAFVVGSSNSSKANYIADGTKEFTVTAYDVTGKEKQLTRTVIVDTTKPVVNTPVITTAVGATVSGVSWYKSRSLLIEVTATDTNGSGVSKVEYTTDNGTTWNPLSYNKTSGKYTGTVSFASDGKNLSFKVRGTDVAENVSEVKTVTVNIDTTAPTISVNKEGIFYVQKNSSITVYGNYEDTQSGVKALTFKIDDTTISPTVSYSATAISGNTIPADSTYKTYANSTPDTIKSWKAVFTPTKSGKFGVQGENRAGDKTSEIKAFDITLDEEAPAISNVKFEEVIGTGENATTKDAYFKTSDSKYYVKNTDKTFKISGVSTDDTGIESVALTVTNTATSLTPTMAGSTGKWSFALDMKTWTTGATAVVTVTDKAGRTTTETLDIVFDVTAPVSQHIIDDKNKDLVFRIGDYANDDGDPDVGGKYSSGTYGSALSMLIRGNFPDADGENGSGINKFYYKTFNNLEVTIDDTKENGYSDTTAGKIYFKTRNDLKDYVIANKTDVFSPLATTETRTVEYNWNIGTAENPVYVKEDRTITSNYKETIKGFQEGKNYLVIVAEDNAGNSAVDFAEVLDETYYCYSLNVDITAPTIPTKHEGSVYTNVIASDSTEQRVEISGTVSDKPNVANGSSGIKEIVFTSDQNNEKVTFTSFTDATAAEQTDAGDTTLKHWTVDVRPLLEGEGTAIISALVTDNAGYSTSVPVANITVDKSAPTVGINPLTSDADSSTTDIDVNGTIELSGTSSDANGVERIIGLVYKKAATATKPDMQTNFAISTAVSSWTAPSGWTKANYTLKSGSTTSSWTFQNINTETINNTTAASTVYLCVAVQDKAGNIGFSDPYKVIVDQDTDRPVIVLSNPSNLSALNTDGGSVTWEMAEISGTVTDDDAITYFGYHVGNAVSYIATDYTQITISNGIWKIQDLEDGPNKVYFKITAGGKDYYANTSPAYSLASIYDTTNSRGTYRLTDGTNKFGYRPASGTTTKNELSLVIDTTAPDVETAEYSLDNGVTWQTGLGSVTLGGTLNDKLMIRQSAWDMNTVKSMTVKVIETVNGVDVATPLFNKKYDTLASPAYVPTENPKDNGKTYLIFTTEQIVLDSWTSTYKKSNTDSNAKRVEITMDDGIKTTVSKLDLTVDNTPPVITFNGPDSGSINSGEITVHGITNEIGNIYYTVSTSGTTKPSLGQKLTSWTGYTVSADGSTITPKNNGTISGDKYAPDYVQIPNPGVSWYVYFDGNQTDSTRAHAVQLKNYATSLGITSDLQNFKDLVNFYIWIKIEDAVGNSEEYPYLVCVDPQGDRPTVTLSNPENPGDSVGGTVKLYGSAEDTNGTVESVYVQLLSAKNGTGYGAVSVTDNNITAFSPTSKDLDFWKSKGYTVEKIKPETNGTHKAWTGTTASPGTLLSGETASEYGIKANFSGTSWNLKINTQNEFDPAANATTANNMAVRIYACDNDKNTSYPVTRYFKMDKDTPVISNVILKKYNGNTAIASQEVRPGMYVKGVWYLEFTATDNEVVDSIALADSNNEEIALTSENATIAKTNVNIQNPKTGEFNNWTVKYALPTGSGVGSFKRTIKASDATNHTGTYEIDISYDNEAPKLLVDSASEFDIASDVRQNNGFYKLYSKVSDASSSGTPSGVKAVGFYFMRRKAADEGLIYDPMQKRANPISTKNLTYADGLYWMSGSVSCDASGAITLTNDDESENDLYDYKAYVHPGSYIKLNGVMYKIETVNDTVVTIEESFEAVTTAQIALAQFIDNRKSEYEATTAKDPETGYYTSIKNDDNDGMIEELGGTTALSSWQGSIVSRNIPDGPIEIHYTAFDESLNYTVGVVGNTSLDTYKNYTTKEVDELWTFNEAGTTRVSLKTPVLNGDYASYVYSYNNESPAYISNNAPRLAGVKVAVDYTGTGNLSDATVTDCYYLTDDFYLNGHVEIKPTAVTDNLVIAETTTNNGTTTYAGITKIKGKTWLIPEMVGGNGKLWYTYNIYSSGANGAKSSTSLKTTTTATYFADGQEDFDEYKVSSGGKTYVTSHTVKKGNATEDAGFEFDTGFFGTTQGASGYIPNSTLNAPTWFDITIYDSTEATSTAATVTSSTLAANQKAYMSVALAVQIHDEVNPNVVINPFYWKSSTENSLYNNSTANGHIELEKDWITTSTYTTNAALAAAQQNAEYDGDPKVSGKIKVEGYAYDNIRLSQLQISVVDKNGTAVVANSKLPNNTVAAIYGTTWADSSTQSAVSGLTKGSLSTDGWEFTVSNNSEDGAYNNADGHKVKWTLSLDTSKITGVAATDITVKVVAIDKASRSSANRTVNTTATTDTDKHKPTYQMDVVPYITKVYTALAKSKVSNWSVYNRTALGHYPVQSIVSNIQTTGNNKITLKTTTSEDVTLYGFNLNASTAKIVSGSNNFATNETGTLKIDYATDGQLKFNVAKLQTGELNLSVNSISVLNNLNNNDANGAATEAGTAYINWYNRQGNGDTNNIQTDDVIFDVWEFNDRASVPLNGLMTGITMEINQKTKMLNYAATNGGLFYNMGGNTNATAAYDATNSYSSYYWAGDWDTFAGPCVGFHVDELGYTYSVASGGDTNNNGAADKYALFTSRWGIGAHSTQGTYGTNGQDDSTNSLRLGYIALKTGNGTYDYNLMKYRYLSSEFASSVKTDNSTNLYLVYYDALTNQIRFKAGNFSGNTRNRNIGGFVDEARNESPGYYNNTNSQIIANGADSVTFKTSNTQSVTINGIQDRGAGQYVDIAVVKGKNAAGNDVDVVCVVWYDNEVNKLKFSYIIDPISNWNSLKGNNTAANWSTPQTIFEEGGEYCHIVSDKNNHLHIAAYAGNGDVKYAYLDTYTSTASTCTVDASGAVGEHLTLDVAVSSSGHSIPYIGYYTSAIKMPKYAYLVDKTTGFNQTAAGVDEYERFTGDWEVTVVPSPSKMTTNREDKVNIGVWKNAGVLTDSKIAGANNTRVVGTSSINNTLNGYSSTNWSKTFGNGTSNAVLGYQISTSTGSCLETAQLR